MITKYCNKTTENELSDAGGVALLNALDSNDVLQSLHVSGDEGGTYCGSISFALKR
jgi:hypothetical protein